MAEDMERAVEMIRESYDAFNRGDFDAAAENLHPDVVFQRVADVEGSLEGQAAVRDSMTPDVWQRQELEIHRLEVIGESIVVDATFHASGAGSGIELDQIGYHVWRIKDGKGAEFRFFLDREEAVAAASSGG
jgi:ketosteroid isomerase-like protein